MSNDIQTLNPLFRRIKTSLGSAYRAGAAGDNALLQDLILEMQGFAEQYAPNAGHQTSLHVDSSASIPGLVRLAEKASQNMTNHNQREQVAITVIGDLAVLLQRAVTSGLPNAARFLQSALEAAGADYARNDDIYQMQKTALEGTGTELPTELPPA